MNSKSRRFPVALVPVLLLLCGLFACEKEVNIHINPGSPKVVVDGYIESGQPPIVILTNTIGYFSKIDLSAVQNSFVHGAVVTVSDGTRSITLKEYGIDTTNATYYAYTVDTADLSSLTFLGQPDKYYQLTINVGGKTYTATTKIPLVKPVDSLWSQAPAQTPDSVPTARQLYIRYTDPDTPGNRVRYFTSTNHGPYLPARNSVFDDQVINGTSFILNLPAGDYGQKDINFDSLGYVFVGDTVTLKWSAIDNPVYNFWNTFDFSQQSVGNPFSAPISITTNITGGALGVWAGYGASTRTIVVAQ